MNAFLELAFLFFMGSVSGMGAGGSVPQIRIPIQPGAQVD